MKYKNFEELTYEEKVEFIRKEFGIIGSNLYDIEEVIKHCNDIGYINSSVVDNYKALKDISLEIAIRIYTDYDNLKEAYVDCTSTDSALCGLKMIYMTLTDPDFGKDLGNLIDKYEEKYKGRG